MGKRAAGKWRRRLLVGSVLVVGVVVVRNQRQRRERNFSVVPVTPADTAPAPPPPEEPAVPEAPAAPKEPAAPPPPAAPAESAAPEVSSDTAEPPRGPYPNSVLPLPDGGPPTPDHLIKGNTGSMLGHRPDSPYYGRTRAEVYFRTEQDAAAAGFRLWSRKR